MPTSQKQIAANRRNAQRSTGPRTPQGKAISSRNALTHGILARRVLITSGETPDDPLEFDTLADGLCHDLSPSGPLEELLVQQLASAYWRLRRALAADAALFADLSERRLREERLRAGTPNRTYRPPPFPDSSSLLTLTRYQSSILREIDRALKQLHHLQCRRASAQNENCETNPFAAGEPSAHPPGASTDSLPTPRPPAVP